MASWNVQGTGTAVPDTKAAREKDRVNNKKTVAGKTGAEVTSGMAAAAFAGYASGVALDFSKGQVKTDAAVRSDSYTAQAKTVQEMQAGQVLKETQEAKSTEDVMESNRSQLSERDADELSEEGFSLEKFDEERLQRALERMQLQQELQDNAIENQIAENKQFRDDMIRQAIAIAVKNGVSENIAAKLCMADLPATLENEYRLKEAVSQAEAVKDLTDGMKAFLVSSESEPTIGLLNQSRYMDSTYASGNHGDNGQWDEIKEQAQNILTDAGYPVTDETMEDARWLFEHQLPISGDTMDRLAYLNDLSDTEWTEEKITSQVVAHMAAGKDAQNTVLAGDGIEALTARRKLEEVRLAMTLESGQRREETGVVVDTDGMQQQIDQMKEQERAYYQSLLSEASCEVNEDTISLLEETVVKTSELRQMPAYLVGVTYGSRDVQTIDSLHEAGTTVKNLLDKAGERYETMMTVPRSDLGDSLSKAFAHTEDILSGLGLEPTEANKRAVRILGYNQMEITAESVISMKNYDAKVQSVLKQMQPSVVAELVKRGENPLDMKLDELGQKTASIMEELGVTDEEKYSSFLWKAQQDGTIQEDQREAFIGIYRLLNQVEKSDGAAVGALVKSGREVTLSSLLSAVRSSKHAGMDVRVDDQFGELKELTYHSMSITQQIEAYYDESEGQKESSVITGQEMSVPASQGHNSAAAAGMAETVHEEEMEYVAQMVRDVLDNISPALLKQAAQKSGQPAGGNAWDCLKDLSLEQFRETLLNGTDSAEAETACRYEELEYYRMETKDCQDAVELLKQYEIPTTFEMVVAAKQMLRDGKDWYQKLDDLDEEHILERSVDSLMDCLGEDNMEETFREFDENAGEVLRNALENPNNTVEQFEQVRRMGTRIFLGQNLREKNYVEIPYSDGEQMALMRVQVRQGKGQAQTICIRRDSERYGQMSAQLTVQNGQVTGYAFYDTRDGMDAAKEQIEAFSNAVGELGMEVGEFHHAMAHAGVMNGRDSAVQDGVEPEQKENLKILFQVAKAYVLSMKEAKTE